MIVSQGDIWIVNLNPMKKSNEMGKVRPALIFQNDKLNLHYPSVIIIPLSSDLVDDAEPIRFRINKRDKLYKDSDLVLTQIRAIDKSRLIEKVGSLTKLEFEYIKKLFLELL
jgi:mRNA interferase MazF